MNKQMKEGYTTGSCAAAAAKAATWMLLKQSIVKQISINLPIDNREVSFLIYGAEYSKTTASCYVIKDAGDDPDITNGVRIYARVSLADSGTLLITGGKGIGIATKPGLPVNVGESAINPVPRKMIKDEITKILINKNDNLKIEISIPNGEELAKKTLNSHLGIVGGLSILGTSGIVKPMSEEAYKTSLVPQLKVAYALGFRTIVLTPGNIGHKNALKNGLKKDAICQTSNFIGYMLENSANIGFEKIILWGHPGKLVKVAAGNFHTHNRVSDARMETIAAYLALLKAPTELIEEILDSITVERAIELVEKNKFEIIWPAICEKISRRAERYLFNNVQVGTVLMKNRENLLAYDKQAKEFGEELGWQASIL